MKKSTEKTAVKTLSPKEAAAKHIAAVQAKKDAAKDMAQAEIPTPTNEELHEMAASESAANSSANLRTKKPASIPRQKPANKPPVAPVKAAETAPATDNKPKVEKTVEPSAKEKKQAARVEYVRKAADILVKSHFANSVNELNVRTSADEVQKGDYVIYHSKEGFY